MAYTAAEVRDMIDGLRFGRQGEDDEVNERSCAMLKEYADRLEQDDQDCDDCLNNESFDKGHAVGQREVYREIAALDPYDTAGDADCCNFCGYDMHQGQPDSHYDDGSTWTPNHEPDCLWNRATAALRETTPTP